DLFVLDEVEHVDLTGVDGELRAAIVAVLVAELGELGLDDAAELALVLEDRVQLLDGGPQLLELVAQLLALELRQAPQLHVEDVVGLDLAELERLGDEA